MRAQHWGLLLVGLTYLIGLSVWLTRAVRDDEPAPPPAESAAQVAEETPAAVDEFPAFVVVGPDPLAGRVGEGLNAEGSTGRRDLQVLQEILTAWRTNAPRGGNPVGNNQEITAALTGDNPWRVEIIPPDHPAINSRGELCDRWGEPLFFHQLSGDRMEIWSNGPDRLRGTEDDVIVVPGGVGE